MMNMDLAELTRLVMYGVTVSCRSKQTPRNSKVLAGGVRGELGEGRSLQDLGQRRQDRDRAEAGGLVQGLALAHMHRGDPRELELAGDGGRLEGPPDDMGERCRNYGCQLLQDRNRNAVHSQRLGVVQAQDDPVDLCLSGWAEPEPAAGGSGSGGGGPVAGSRVIDFFP